MEEDLELFQEQAVTKYVMTYSLGSWIYDGIELCMFIKNAKRKILMILEANLILYFFCFPCKLENLLIIKTRHLITLASTLLTVSVSYFNVLNIYTWTRGGGGRGGWKLCRVLLRNVKKRYFKLFFVKVLGVARLQQYKTYISQLLKH